MKEFIEKLIGRLEEEKKYCSYHPHTRDEAINKAIKIVNELAEEFGKDTNVTTKDGWIPCSESLPEANQKVLTCDKDGWISVNVNMPYIGVRNDFECGYYVAWMPLPAPYKEGE